VRQNDRIHRSEIDMASKFRERVGPQVKDDPCRTTFDEKPAATLPGIAPAALPPSIVSLIALTCPPPPPVVTEAEHCPRWDGFRETSPRKTMTVDRSTASAYSLGPSDLATL
jgi:hypothetical protein